MEKKQVVTVTKGLGLVALCGSILLAGCGDSDSTTAKKTIAFSGVPTPTTETEKQSILASNKVTVDGKEYAIGFHTILRSGDQPGGDGVFGKILKADGTPITLADGSEYISNDNDFSSLLTGKTDNKLYMVSHFEYSPGAMYVTELSQNTSTGELTAVRTKNIDFSSFKGGWVHCAGSVTPWGTHLGSEEYEPDARKVNATTGALPSYSNNQARYFGLNPADTTAGAFSSMNAYNYGWQIEVTVNSYTDVQAEKHYAMGRVAHELAYVMPNKKTAYIADDGTNVGLYRFEAKTAGDLSEGELFAAKWVQTSAANGGAANLEWISLGSASDDDIKSYLTMNITFSDIFETATPDATTNACATGFTATQTSTGLECLKVKPGMAKAASRLETRRYAAMLGATTEFNKMEGITHDPDANIMYLAMSDVTKGMKDNDSSSDKGGPNHIKLPENRCGTVYALTLDGNFVATKMEGVVSGTAKTYTDAALSANKCDVDGIASPDNVTFMPGYKTLIIGEDTSSHQNDMIWAYNIETKALTRIQTTPYGAETTSPYFYPNINGWGYLMSVVQHPYGESDTEKLPDAAAKRAYTGYIGPFPAMK